MPRAIPYYDLVFHVVRYLVRRQLDHRPTTLSKLCNRFGHSVADIRGQFEIEHVEYVLVPHGKEESYRTTEILIRQIPQSLVVELGIDNQKIRESFDQAIKELEPVADIELPDSEFELREIIDPFSAYRIEDRTFEILKPYLIPHEKLVSELYERGIPKKFVSKYLLLGKLHEKIGPVWRPYYYEKKPYFLKKCIRHIRDVETYLSKYRASPSGQVGKNRRKRIKPQNPGLFTKKSV